MERMSFKVKTVGQFLRVKRHIRCNWESLNSSEDETCGMTL
jgi:hypothetical protein